MGHSQAQKADNRERILALAAAHIRAHGIDSLSVAPLMDAAGLTHGGFYGHFASRDALIAAAIVRALDDGAAGAAHASGGNLGEIARSYLSRRHRDSPATGCAIAAIGSETARASDVSRAAMAAQIETFIAGVRPFVADDGQAALAVSAMVGALTLARIYPDRARADSLLKAVRTAIAALDTQGSGEPGTTA
ncbi:MAG: TetR/AcrR family transcriptional regulator [Sphingomonas sp.]|uniref:TetR/AcrR family transcriptional regulator n=1 Tax=Sphingomonas sp. TaxID=28214 RepID=UPI00182955CD|nr:TetR/AcrR family transcriptional regulator [Zymomonas sp.]MBA4040808.1 TetR/AcrR family transcriptional regulator [Sphingobium sp.]MBA4773976.1 TetR/AcrR family transcriptional regulator [Sphingomonas sp.]